MDLIAPQQPQESSWRSPARLGIVAGGAAVAIALFNPTDTGQPICLSRILFGVDCPACGGLRCVNALMRGHFLVAADHNLIAAVALPLLAVGWLVWMVASLRGHNLRLPEIPNWATGLLAAAVIAFTVARNIGGMPWADWLASTTY